MSWFSNLANAYDRTTDIAGVVEEGKENQLLLPIYHMMANTDICVAIDGNGKFLRAEKSPLSICIPCTEDSSTRSGNLEPHPLHEQLKYLALDDRKRNTYMSRLEEWCNFHSKVKAVKNYIAKGTLLADLSGSGIKVAIDSVDESGNKKLAKDVKKETDEIDNLFIRFRVEVPGDLNPNLWEDKSIVEAWQEYCQLHDKKEQTLCYITGKMSSPTMKHPKGTYDKCYNAKLVSCNDKTNYTFKGRFKKPDQANSISMEASQKAHAMLKYLVASHGYKCDSQAIVAWAVDNGDAQPDPFASTNDLYGTVVETKNSEQLSVQGELYTDYAKKLRAALSGFGGSKALDTLKNKEQARRVAVMAMDAATKGRMGITFYQDLPQNQYIERIIAWHDSCKWWFRQKDVNNGQDYISAPSADRIITAVYGEPKEPKGDGYIKIQKQARERLLHSIICGEPIDRGWVSAAVARVSQPFSFNKQDGGWDMSRWCNALNVTCAIVRSTLVKNKKEVFGLELDKTCRDRGYLFGRLLAIADRLESHARFLQEGKTGGTEKRPTNAVRYMSAFASKPLRTWSQIHNQLNPYIQRLNGAEWYQQQIDEIMSLFDSSELSDKPLDGKYLLGYSLQRRALTNKNDKEEDQNHEFN